MRVFLLLSFFAFPAWAQSPEQVMNDLLSALQDNNADNDGIVEVFARAAPENKAMTGPLPRFIRMVSAHPYGELLNHQSAVLGPAETRDNQVTFPIRLISKEGRAMGYIWTLAQQPDEQWMTTSVYPVAVNGQGL